MSMKTLCFGFINFGPAKAIGDPVIRLEVLLTSFSRANRYCPQHILLPETKLEVLF